MSKEIDEFKAKQEVNKAAELKAKLDMVETRPISKYGRKHRKIGEMVCKTGIKSGWREATASFVLRLDSRTGDFVAEHGDVQYVSKSRDALQAKMDEVARVTFDLKWSRYLLVDYKAEVPYKDHWSSTTTLDIDAPRRADSAVYGIKLSWDVVEYSDAIQLPGQGERFMKREVGDDGVTCGAQETVAELPDGLVPYSKERVDTLRRIRAALADVDAKMVKLFRGTPTQVARALDSVTYEPFLLEAPKKSKR